MTKPEAVMTPIDQEAREIIVKHALWDAGFCGEQSAERGPVMLKVFELIEAAHNEGILAERERCRREVQEARAEGRLEGAYIQQQLDSAKRFLNNGDAHMANYCLRDLKICEEMGRTDLLWAYHNGNPCEREIKDEIEKVIHFLKIAPVSEGAGGGDNL